MTTRLIHSRLEDYIHNYQSIYRAGYAKKYSAVLCDPPYYLGEIVKRFGKTNSAPSKHYDDGSFSRLSRGFMGQTWDGFESPKHYQLWVEQWATGLLDMVYPGTVGLFFGGSRTYHRLATGLEDAGWELYDNIFAWVYGTGMPKSYNLRGTSDTNWDGYGTALKPSCEPIVLARAPRNGYTYDDCAQLFGTGALNIKDTRVNGRWMANSVFLHHPECRDHYCVPSCHVRQLSIQSGVTVSGGMVKSTAPSAVTQGIYGGFTRQDSKGFTDSGSASRFFYTGKAQTWEREAGLHQFEAEPFAYSNGGQSSIKNNTYENKATDIGLNKVNNRRNPHPTVKPIDLITHLASLIKPAKDNARLLVPFAGVGSEMIGAHLAGWQDITGIEMTSDYIPIAKARLDWWCGRFDSVAHAKQHHDEFKQTSCDTQAEQLTLWEMLG